MKSHTKPPQYAAIRRFGQAGPRLRGTLPTLGLQPISSPLGADHSWGSPDAILRGSCYPTRGYPEDSTGTQQCLVQMGSEDSTGTS